MAEECGETDVGQILAGIAKINVGDSISLSADGLTF